MKKICLLLVLLFLSFPLCGKAAGEAPPPPEYFHAVVLKAVPVPVKNGTGSLQRVTIRLTDGAEAGKETAFFHNVPAMKEARSFLVKEGDQVVIAKTFQQGSAVYRIADFSRLPYLYGLAAFFGIMLFAIGGKRGFKSIVVIALPLAIVFYVMMPLILSKKEDILFITLALSVLTASLTQVIVSGWNAKTLGAFLGASGGVAMAALLSYLSITLMHLSGLESEEANTLRLLYLPDMNFQDILFAGLMLSALGTVMDTAISVASSQYEVKAARPDISCRALFTSGVRIGRDIMGTCSNTLILAYLGGFFPLILLMLSAKDTPFWIMINSGAIASELVRSLTGCIGLICTIPISSLTTAWCLTRKHRE